MRKAKGYPWINIWRHRFRGRVAALGFECGTTGFQKLFPVRVEIGKVLDRPLYAHVGVGETVEKS